MEQFKEITSDKITELLTEIAKKYPKEDLFVRFHQIDTFDAMSGHICPYCNPEDCENGCDEFCPSREGRYYCSADNEEKIPMHHLPGAVCAFLFDEDGLWGYDHHIYQAHGYFTIFIGREIPATEFEVPEGAYVYPKKILGRYAIIDELRLYQ